MSGANQRPNIRGRAAGVQPDNPYLRTLQVDDFEHVADDAEYLDALDRPPTQYLDDESQTIVATNDSPDVSFNYSVNPYRGCSHGCSYCYARPGHEYLGMSAGIDFETKILVKRRAPELLRQFLARPKWNAETIVFSGVTDCYQPAEREFKLTRGCLEVLAECRQPVGLITKNALITRDVDLLQELAAHQAVRVAISVTALDQSLVRVMEPRTSAPPARLRAIETLAKAGIPTNVMIHPDERDDRPDHSGAHRQRSSCHSEGCQRSGGDRRPSHDLAAPHDGERRLSRLDRAAAAQSPSKVEAFVRTARGGKLNTTEFGQRMRGTGPLVDQIEQTLRVFAKRYGLDGGWPPLNREAFRPPRISGAQLPLF